VAQAREGILFPLRLQRQSLWHHLQKASCWDHPIGVESAFGSRQHEVANLRPLLGRRVGDTTATWPGGHLSSAHASQDSLLREHSASAHQLADAVEHGLFVPLLLSFLPRTEWRGAFARTSPSVLQLHPGASLPRYIHVCPPFQPATAPAPSGSSNLSAPRMAWRVASTL
jgi:hypothetical protein